MTDGSTLISQYFSPASKRGYPSTSSEGDNSFSSVQPTKRMNIMNDTSVDPVQAALKELFEKMNTLSTKEDVQEMKTQVQTLSDTMMKKLEKLEGEMLEVESKQAAVQKEVKLVKGKTTRIEHNLNDHELRIRRLEKEMNDAEQFSRRWNLRVYKIPEASKETPEDCVKKSCNIFSDYIGVPTSPQDIEVAHRTGRPDKDRARPILVRFFDRKKRDAILQKRKVLKGKGLSVDEDLTFGNYELTRKAFKHSATLAVWSSNGKILAKLKNNVTVRLNIHSDLESEFSKVMDSGRPTQAITSTSKSNSVGSDTER